MATKTKTVKAKKVKATKPKPARAVSKSTKLTVDGIIKQLRSLGDEATRKHNAKWGAGDNQFGVKRGDLRTLANKIKTNHELALSLWQTGNLDAQFLATLLLDVNQLSADELDRLVRAITFAWVAEWLHSYVTKEHADKETLRQKWMADDDRWAARAGWQLTAGRVAKSPDGLDLDALLNRIEKELATAAPETQWTMNGCLAEIGINHAKHRKRAIAIGEKLGVFRDYPVSKGCTSPFAPIWINEMVRRKG
jgi:3-methyladenine DNA glycosylase AlkD